MSNAPRSRHEPDGTFHHGPRGRFNAWFFSTFDRYANHIARAHKRTAFAGLAPGQVLELGPGVGANLAYLAPGSRLLALEPNLAMHDRLRERCARHGILLTVIARALYGAPRHLGVYASTANSAAATCADRQIR